LRFAIPARNQFGFDPVARTASVPVSLSDIGMNVQKPSKADSLLAALWWGTHSRGGAI
jgi:hypothetical protein